MELMHKATNTMNSDMGKLNEQVKYLSGAWDENGVKLSLFQSNLNSLLDVDIRGWTEENKQEWVKAVKEMLKGIQEIEKIKKVDKMIAELARNLGDLFSDLGVILGESFFGSC